MTSKKNLISLIVVMALFAALIVTGLAGNIRAGNYIAIPIIFTALAITGFAILASRWRVRLMLRDKTPDRIIAHYHRAIRRVAHADAVAAYLSALAATFFGDFTRAHKELDAIEWNNVPAGYRQYQQYVLALLAILEDTDYPKALRIADDARQLDPESSSGGAQRIEDVIRTVASDPGSDMLSRLQTTATKQSGLIPGLCAWALAIYHMRHGDAEKAADYKERLRMSVPHAAPLVKPQPPAPSE